jgi:hypothetical protein
MPVSDSRHTSLARHYAHPRPASRRMPPTRGHINRHLQHHGQGGGHNDAPTIDFRGACLDQGDHVAALLEPCCKQSAVSPFYNFVTTRSTVIDQPGGDVDGDLER